MDITNTIPFPTVGEMVDILIDNKFVTTIKVLLQIRKIDAIFSRSRKYTDHPNFPKEKTRHKIIEQAATMMPKWSQKFRDEPLEKHIFYFVRDNYASTREDAKFKIDEIMKGYGIDDPWASRSFKNKILKVISKFPKRELESYAGTITKSKLKSMVDECFKHTLKLGMLEQEQIDTSIIEIINKPIGHSQGGISRGKVFLRFNFGSVIVHSPNNPISKNNIEATKDKSLKEQYKAIRKAQLRGKWGRIEYPDFWKDKDIGLWVGNSEDGGWRGLVAHEMSHAVNLNSTNKNFQNRVSGHDHGFKKVYKILRKKMLS